MVDSGHQLTMERHREGRQKGRFGSEHMNGDDGPFPWRWLVQEVLAVGGQLRQGALVALFTQLPGALSGQGDFRCRLGALQTLHGLSWQPLRNRSQGAMPSEDACVYSDPEEKTASRKV